MFVGCAGEEAAPESVLTLPDLTAADFDGSLKVVATTSLIGDVVAQVGGGAIELTVLIRPGQDPHSYEPSTQDLATVSNANVIFVNGWDLEEALVENLAQTNENVPLVPISAHIQPLALSGHDDHHHGTVDPHVWFDVGNVAQWVENVATVLSELDPAGQATFEANATAYLAELTALETYVAEQIDPIPPERRLLVTNHDSLGYFAAAYNFELIGTVIPGVSTLAEPSARDLTNLISTMESHSLCTLFAETTVSDTLAQTVADELEGCAEVQVISIYTGSLSPAGQPADSYLTFYQFNIDAIVNGLK